MAKKPAIDLSLRLTCSVEECCASLGIGKTSCYELLNSGAFESFRLGTQRLIVVASIQRFVEAMSYQNKVAGGN